MLNDTDRPASHADLIAIIRDVRRRWRLKLAMRGAAAAVTLAIVALLAAAFGLQTLRFTPASILAFRIVIGIAFGAIGYWFLARPLLRRVSDEQVALYLEEHEPSLEAAIISAVEADRDGGSADRSPLLVRRLVESAVEKCRAIEHGRRIERQPVRRYSAATAVVLLTALAVFLLGPAYLRHAVSALLVISRSVEAAAPYRIEVKPGHATIPRGADQSVTAMLVGFDADQAGLMVRKSPAAPFERLPLVRATGNRYDGMLFNVAAPVEYFVEAAGVRSPVYTLKVADMPYVQRLELEYHFPAYTGLAPRKIEDGGDIAVLRGTEIRLRAIPTMAAAGGLVVVDDKSPSPLTVGSDGSLSGRFTADHDGFYRIELDAPNGPHVNGSPQYTIDVLDDQPPSVSFSKPGRDTTASPIEEVFVEAKAQDDFGVKNLELAYAVNGGPATTLKLFDGAKRLTDVTAGHTFYLEEMNVQAGDFVSYYARATDNDTVQGPQRATSDLYFIRVRPLQKDFRRAPSQAGGGGGGGNNVGQLSEQQRQIISATFNVQRDRKKMSADKLRESTTVVALSQAKLREQVSDLVNQMRQRLGAAPAGFNEIVDLLAKAVDQMKPAESKLQARDPEGALPPEQKALQFLQQAEEKYQLQISVSRGGGGGGGGGGKDSMAEDLADLFQLELDRMANQYETTERASQQQRDQKIDELAEKLKELARRQEQEAERQRRQAMAGQSGSGGGSQQRALADQAEEAARQLERLAREENRPELADSARQLQQAADAMRRAASSNDSSAAAQASAAMQRLQEAQRQLQQLQGSRGQRDIADAQRRAEEMAREQADISAQAQKLDPSAAGAPDKAQQLAQRKDALEAKAGELERQLDRTAGAIQKDERDAARKLTEAANGIRDSRLRDKIKYSKGFLPGGSNSEYARSLETDIGSNIDALRKRIGDAAAAMGHSQPDAMSQALQKARELARGMESLDQRMREAANAQGKGQKAEGKGQKAEGKQGQSGQQGQQGQQGGGREGNPNAPPNAMGDSRGGDNQPSGMGGTRPGGRFTPEDVRQFRGEARQRANDAQDRRRLMRNRKLDTRALDEVMRGLQALQQADSYHDPDALAKMQTALTAQMKRLEFELRRKIDANGNQVFLSGNDEVPEAYRKLVEQYYRALSKGKQDRR